MFILTHSARRLNRSLFTFNHFRALTAAAVDHFARDSSHPLNLVAASRLHLGSCSHLTQHMGELLIKMVTVGAIFDLAIPMIVSALILDSCPPGMHCK